MPQDHYLFVNDGFSLQNDELMLAETLFHNANGYLGVRSNFEEGYPEGYNSIRGTYLNGFYDFAEMKQAEKLCGMTEEKQTMLNVADTQTIELFVGGERFSLFEGEVLERSRTLDMRRGITTRRVLWRAASGKTVEITSTRMTSFALLPLFTIEYSVRAVNFAGEVTLRSTHVGEVLNYSDPSDPRVAAESFKHILPSPARLEGGTSLVTAATSKSGLRVTSAVRHVCSRPVRAVRGVEGSTAVHTFTLSMQEGETVTLTKYTVLCDSVRFEDTETAALETMDKACAVPLSGWYQKQEDYLTAYWQNCAVQVEGDEELSIAVCYNLYQLLQSVGKDPHSNIAAKGLSGEGYEGHYFWDTEMYMMPFFSLTNPEVAKNLIRYRYTILDGARENARILGHQRGALYPWRTIMGKECSGYFPSGSAQYHINGDIAYSIITYYLLTDDLDFIAQCGAEVLFETARLWMDAGNFYQGRFCINDVTGPDEYTCIVNNNYYTNALAQHHLRWCKKLYDLLEEKKLLAPVAEKIGLTRQEVETFDEAARLMTLPYDEALDINPQDDSFLQKKVWDLAATPKENFPLLLHYHPLCLYRYQVCKQADTVLAHFILEDAQKLSTIRNSFHYYEKVTTHDSSLSTCIFSIVASKLGEREKAYEYFGESSKLDIFNTHKNTKDGIHTANMGGTFMAIVYGFGGLRVKEDGLHFAPALPAGWKSFTFNIHYHDSLIGVRVGGGDCVFTLISGSAKEITVYGKRMRLEKPLTVKEEK